MAWLVYAGLLAACAGALPLTPADTGPRTHNVYIVNDRWHTTIVMPIAELIATGAMPETDDFGDASFLAFGWGDRVYYPAEEATVGMALEAALTATRAIIHVAPLPGEPGVVYAKAEVLPVRLTRDGFLHMARAIAGEIERPTGRRATPVERGLSPGALFYHAHGTFHLFNTCNTWTGRMLRAGGVDVSSTGVVTAEDLMIRLRAAVALARRSPR